jgi:hypothetical protein
MISKINGRNLLRSLLVAAVCAGLPGASFGQQYPYVDPYGNSLNGPSRANCLAGGIQPEGNGYEFEFKNTCDSRIALVYDSCWEGAEGRPQCKVSFMVLESNASSGLFWNFALPPRPRNVR